jgi:hypothetical protein
MWFRPPKRNTLRPRENGVVLLKSTLPEPAFLSDRESIFDPPEEVSTRSFYSSTSDSYNETQSPTDGPKWLKPYTVSRALMARNS